MINGLMGPNDEFASDVMENEGIETPNVYEQLEAALADNKILTTAIVMLKQKLDYHRIPYFNESYIPLTKKPSEMTREELAVRNKESQVRIENNRHVKSGYAIPMPTPEAEMERLTSHAESSAEHETVILSIFQTASENGGVVTVDQLKGILKTRVT